MNALSQGWWEDRLHGTLEHGIEHGALLIMVSLLGALGASLMLRWKLSRYSMRIVTRVCWIEHIGHRKVLIDKVVRADDALEISGSTDVARTIVKATKKARTNTALDGDYWAPEVADRALRRICYRVEEMFAPGAVAKAMKEEDVHQGIFQSMAFRRNHEVSVIMITEEDLEQFGKEGCGSIEGDGAELREINEMYTAFSAGSKFIRPVDVYS